MQPGILFLNPSAHAIGIYGALSFARVCSEIRYLVTNNLNLG